MPTNSIPIELGGQRRSLRFDFNALCALEEESDISILEIGKTLEAGSFKISTIRTILRAGLLHDNPKLTLHEVGAMIDLASLPTIMEAVTEAITAAFPDDKGGDLKNEKGSKPKP